MEGNSVTNALSTAFTSIAGDMSSTIATILPIALGIVGTVMVVMLGIKLFRKITNRAN